MIDNNLVAGTVNLTKNRVLSQTESQERLQKEQDNLRLRQRGNTNPNSRTANPFK